MSSTNRCGVCSQAVHRFRNAERWVEQIHQGLLDGALVSSLAVEQPLLSHQGADWACLHVKPLDNLALQLVATTPAIRQVLLPRPWASRCSRQPVRRRKAAAWLKCAKDQDLTLPICLELMGSSWLDQHGFAPLPEQSLLIEQLWLLLPEGSENNNAGRQVLRQSRRDLNHRNDAESA